MQRALDTGDNVYDYQFDFANGQATNTLEVGEDAMIIQLGRARVWINADSFSTGMAGPAKVDTTTQLTTILSTFGYISIPVTADAFQLVSSTVAAVAGVVGSIYI